MVVRRLFAWGGTLVALGLGVWGFFALYSYFVVDYSLESLEFALSATEKVSSPSASQVSQNVYQNLIQDLALEEGARENAEFKDMALLEGAVRSLEEVRDRAGGERAKFYLKQAVNSKKSARDNWLSWLDRIYLAFQKVSFHAKSFMQYLKQNIDADTKEQAATDMSSYLILTQAEEKEKKWELEEAEELYRKFLKFYPDHPEHDFVSLTLAHILMKQRKFLEAERRLRGLMAEGSSLETYQLASTLLKKVRELKEKREKIRDLKRRIDEARDVPAREKLLLKLGFQYLHSYSLKEAQEIFLKLRDAGHPTVRQKAKFYLAWIYKLNSQYDQSAEVLLDLVEKEEADPELEVGANAQLADIYYQTNDADKSLKYYEKLEDMESRASPASRKHTEIWSALADMELAVISYFDFNDSVRAREHLNELGGAFDDELELAGLGNALADAASQDIRVQAFQALKQSRVHEAYELFKKKIRRNSQDSWSHSGLALTYLLLGDLYMAEEHGRRGHRLEGGIFTTAALAYVLHYLRQEDEAKDFYEAILSQSDKYVPVKYNLAVLYLEMEEYQKAKGLLEGLQIEFKKHTNQMKAKILNNLGYALWYLGDHEAAIKSFRESLAATPGFPDAEKNLKRVLYGRRPENINSRPVIPGKSA